MVSTDTNRCLLSEEAEREGRPTDWPSLERRYVETMMSDPVVPRMATPEQVAPVVAFLASLLAGHVTGSNYVIDGGYSVGGFRRQGASPSSAAMQQGAIARTAA